MSKPRLTIVIPAYNEARRLPKTLDTLVTLIASSAFKTVEVSEVIVVDDGSKDETIATAKSFQNRLPLKALPSSRNFGKGHAVREGLKTASGAWILVADADMATPWTEIDKLVTGAIDADAPIAIGSRDLPESDVTIHQSWIREHLGKTFNLMVRSITRLPFKDTQCGFKLAERKAIQPWLNRLSVDRFAWDVEFLMRAIDNGLKIVEVPVEWAHQDESRVHPIKDGLNMAYTVLKLRLGLGLGLGLGLKP